MNLSNPNICLVIESLAETAPGSPSALHALKLARLCLENALPLTVLYTGPEWSRQPALEKTLTAAGADFVFLQDPYCETNPKNGWGFLDQSLAVYDFLKNRTHSHIVFEDQRAAFRALQAKRMTGDFENAVLILSVHGPSQRIREQREEWSGMPVQDALISWCERYACEHCDCLVFKDESIRNWLTQNNWSFPENNRILPGLQSTTDATSKNWLALFSEKPPTAGRMEKIRRDIASHPPLVSVVIAHHNYGKYLPASLASFAASPYPNFEVIVVDDASSDEFSLRVFQEIQEQYQAPQYKFLSNPVNLGVTSTRNRGASLARGEYLVFFDSDNIASPELLPTFVESILYCGVDYCTCFHKTFANTAETQAGAEILWEGTPAGAVLEIAWVENIFGDLTHIIKHSAFREIGGFTDGCRHAEDLEFYTQLAMAGHTMDVVPRFLFWYRDNHSGLRHNCNLYQTYAVILQSYTRPLPALYQNIFNQILYPLARLAAYPPERERWHTPLFAAEHPRRVPPGRFIYSLLQQIERYIRKRYFGRNRN